MKKYFGLLGLILLCVPAHPVWAGTVTINTGTTYQTISGFGAASVWVANKITTSLANIFWADDSGQPPASQVNGNVGLSINRILIDESGNSNWGTEAAAAVQALKINPNMRIFGSSWSPPAKWKNNNNVSGNNTGNDNGNPGTNTNQLNASNYQAYANYQTSFVTAMKNTYGFTPYAVSVQNEPDYDTTYQSCLWSAAQFDTYIGTYLGPTLQAAGFTNIIMMPESFMDNLNLSATTMGDANAAKYVKVIGAHLYGGGPNTVPASYSTVAGHAVESWETETSEKTNDGNIDSGLFYANQLHSCIVDHNFNAYCYWWLINLNTDDEGLCDNNSNPTKRLYALGNFSKFIRPGFVRIGATEVPSAGVSVSAYYSASAGKVVIVAINNNTSTQSQTFNLSGFTASTAYPWITDSTRNLVQQTSVAVSGGSFTYTLPAQSITSFVAVGTAGPTDTPTITPTPVVFSTWRVNAGGPAYTDTLGNLWAADENFTGGTTVASGGAVTGTSDSTLYDTQRYGTSFSYSFNVPAGSYQVTLKFAETYTGDFTVGSRVFNVAVNGTTVVSNLDIYGQAGGNTADDKVINNVSPSGGTITIQFTGTASTDTSAVLEAIQIIPMPSSTPTFTATSTPSRTATRTSTATLTSTATSSFTRTWTGTPTFSSTSTASATSTPTSSFTSTRTNTATSTSTLTYTSTPTRTLTATVTNTSTWTSTTTRSSTPTVTLTSTGTATPTETSTSTSTSTATSTNTVPSTLTYTSTATPSLTSTRTSTATVTNTPTFSSTSTATPTFTFTGTFSSTPTRSSTPTSTPTWTSTRTSTPTSTNTVSSTLTYTSTATPSLTSTRTSTATVTNTPTVTSTSTATNTGTVPATMTFTVTSTNVLNTLTSTPTRTSTPTSTSTATSTHTGVNTGTFTATSTSTPTWSPTVTETSSSTETSTRTASSTPTVTNTGTQLPTSTATVTGTSTSTSTDTSTNTPFFTATPTITTTSSNTITFTFTSTKTSTPTFTATPSWTPTDTVTSTSSSTATATASLTWTATPTSSSTSTATNIFTATSTATWTSSSTFTPTWTATKTATSSNTPTVTSTATYTFSATSTWTATVTTTASSTPTWTSTPTVSDCGKVLISSLYPNPVTSGTVKVDLRSACPKNVKWAVYSAAYRKIGEWNITVTGFERVPLWDLTDAKGKKVAAGVYYIVLTPAGQKSQTLPVVVLR